MEHTFTTPDPIQLYVELGRGEVTVDAGTVQQTAVTVDGDDPSQVLVTQDGDQISVIGPKHRGGIFGKDPRFTVTVSLPTRSDLVTKTGSASLVSTGTLGLVKVKSGSGNVQLEAAEQHLVVDTGSGDIQVASAAADVRIKSGSGDVQLARVGGSLGVSTGSGDIQVQGAADAAVLKSGSGDVMLGVADGDLRATTGSGDVSVRQVSRGKVDTKTGSGEIAVGVTRGVPVWTDITTVSGNISSSLESTGEPESGQEYVELRVRTASGDIELVQV